MSHGRWGPFGTGAFHEKACREDCFKKVHLFSAAGLGLWGLAAFPDGAGFHTHSGGGVNGRTVQGGIQGARKRAALLTD